MFQIILSSLPVLHHHLLEATGRQYHSVGGKRLLPMQYMMPGTFCDTSSNTSVGTLILPELRGSRLSPESTQQSMKPTWFLKVGKSWDLGDFKYLISQVNKYSAIICSQERRPTYMHLPWSLIQCICSIKEDHSSLTCCGHRNKKPEHWTGHFVCNILLTSLPAPSAWLPWLVAKWTNSYTSLVFCPFIWCSFKSTLFLVIYLSWFQFTGEGTGCPIS